MKKLIINNKSIFIPTIILIIASRLVAFYFYRDLSLENEWSNLFHNLNISGVLGFNVLINEFLALQKFAEAGDVVIPSVWMPPLYSYFLYAVNIISGNFFPLVTSVIIIQILLNLISIYVFYLLIRRFLSRKNSLLFALVYALFPVLIFSSVQISSISIQIFLIINFFYFITGLIFENKKNSLLFFSVISGLLILIRGEFIFFYILTLIYFFIFKERKLKKMIASLLITFIIISPYLLRNYKNLDILVLTKSFGYNLLKGNNKNFKVEGDVSVINEIRENVNIKITNDYEIKLDDIYKNEAIKYISNNPVLSIKNYFIKVFSFLFIDFNSSYKNYYHPAHTIPKLILSFLSLLGAILGLKYKGFYQYMSFYYFSNIFLFSVFFILPRYSVILAPVQLILISLAIKYFFKR